MYIMYKEMFLNLSYLRDKYRKIKLKIKKEFSKQDRNLTVLEELILEKNSIKHKIKKLEHQLYWCSFIRRNKYVKFKKTLKEMISTLYTEEFHRYRINLKDGYELSVLTGSHFNSAALGTVEIALIKDNEFIYGPVNSDNSIIHYMSWETFNEFIEYMQTAYENNLSDSYKVIFNIYKREE